jgi:predicted DNA-binding protein (MmcQ/YjbR family)
MDRDSVNGPLRKPALSDRGLPFGDHVVVFRIGGKMFALILLSGEPGSVNPKCDPHWVVELRAQHAAVETARLPRQQTLLEHVGTRRHR